MSALIRSLSTGPDDAEAESGEEEKELESAAEDESGAAEEEVGDWLVLSIEEEESALDEGVVESSALAATVDELFAAELEDEGAGLVSQAASRVNSRPRDKILLFILFLS